MGAASRMGIRLLTAGSMRYALTEVHCMQGFNSVLGSTMLRLWKVDAQQLSEMACWQDHQAPDAIDINCQGPFKMPNGFDVKKALHIFDVFRYTPWTGLHPVSDDLLPWQ